MKLQTSAERLGAEPEEPIAGIVVDPVVETPEAAEFIGPLMLIGRPQNGQVELSLVGHLVGGELQTTPDDPGTRQAIAERLSAGQPFALYSEGVRVGTLYSESSRISPNYCGPRPSIRGIAEMVSQAAQAQQFIAVEEGSLQVPRGGFRSPTHDYDQRVASLGMMRDALPVLGATWPPSILEIRRDIQIFQNPGEERPTVAASFVYGDDLGTGAAARTGAYSVFLLGDDRGAGFSSTFLSYRQMGADGKGSPRFFDHLDWDGDGVSEVLLEVLGESSTWVSGLDRTDDGWREVYHDACGLPTPNAPGTP